MLRINLYPYLLPEDLKDHKRQLALSGLDLVSADKVTTPAGLEAAIGRVDMFMDRTSPECISTDYINLRVILDQNLAMLRAQERTIVPPLAVRQYVDLVAQVFQAQAFNDVRKAAQLTSPNYIH
ncbi:hypothetical protein HN587_02500 [Candidatus Woesearchaeota archaeon]|jgi:hypothetical protein|nr:hypothetical protein [Candidatus Woesearchaeota archaeon]